MTKRTRKTRHHNRRGTLYVVVLGVTVIVAAIGLSSMQVARLNLRETTSHNNVREARLLAMSAIEDGIIQLNNDSTWRTTLTNNTEYPTTPISLGRGTFTWKLVDEDGDLGDDESDSVRLFGIGRIGQTVYQESVLLDPGRLAQFTHDVTRSMVRGLGTPHLLHGIR